MFKECKHEWWFAEIPKPPIILSNNEGKPPEYEGLFTEEWIKIATCQKCFEVFEYSKSDKEDIEIHGHLGRINACVASVESGSHMAEYVNDIIYNITKSYDQAIEDRVEFSPDIAKKVRKWSNDHGGALPQPHQIS